MEPDVRILVYGYGNPGRRDDGLGPALADMVEKWILANHFEHIDVESNYQLNIEDACSIADYDMVIFADCTIEQIDDFKISHLKPSDKTNFSMHSVHPAFVVDLCEKIYGAAPLPFLLHIKGYEFDLAEGFTDEARSNLRKSFEFIKSVLKHPGYLIKRFEEEIDGDWHKDFVTSSW